MDRDPRVTDGVVPSARGPVRIRRYEPTDPTGPRTLPLVWLHGGAFVSGGLDQRESHEVGLALARRGVPVIAVDYPLVSRAALLLPSAGANRHPAPHEAVLAVVRAAASHDGLVLGGASAGACLAAAATLDLVRLGTPRIRGAVLAYGTFHARMPPASAELLRRLRGPRRLLHSPRAVALMNRLHAGDALDDPTAFPGGHPLDGFPPTLVLDADRDRIRASGSRFAAELTAAGTSVDHRVLRGSRHGFLHRPRERAFALGIDAIVVWMLRSAPARG